MKRLLLLFLVSLFSTIGWAQSNVGVERQPKVGVETQLFSPSSGSVVPTPTNYALLVGISKYKDTLALATLKYADKDARDFAQFLREQFGKDIKIDTLINDKANSAMVLGKLQQVSESKYTRIFILISGHGGTHKRDTENGYLFTEDFETIELVGNTGAGAVRMGKLRDMMTDLIKKGMSIFLVVDACHAGSFYPEKISEVVSSWAKTDKSGIFLASQKEEKAIESRELENGLLVHYFLKGSRHDADTDSNGLIWVKELGEYIAQKVPEQASKGGHKQTPLTIGRDSLVIFAKQMISTLKDTLNAPASTGFSITDSSSIIKEKLENSIKNKDLEGAYRWLEKFKKLDSLEAFQDLKYTYVAACYNEAVKLSGQLSDFYVAYEFEDDTIRKSETINIKRVSLNDRIDNLLVQLERSLGLLSDQGVYYDEINYRKLVFEGHKNESPALIKEAVRINPDFGYPYLLAAKMYFSNSDIDSCVYYLNKYKLTSPNSSLKADKILAKIIEAKRKKSTISGNLQFTKISVAILLELQKKSFDDKGKILAANDFITQSDTNNCKRYGRPQEDALSGKIYDETVVSCSDNTMIYSTNSPDHATDIAFQLIRKYNFVDKGVSTTSTGHITNVYQKGNLKVESTLARDASQANYWVFHFSESVEPYISSSLPLNTERAKGIEAQTSLPIHTEDTLRKTKEQLDQLLHKKDWKGAYQLLEEYERTGTTKNYKSLRSTYVSACHKEAEDLLILLEEFYEKYEFEADSILLSSPVNQRRNSLNRQIDTSLYGLHRCLALLPVADPYYDEIKYRALVFEGHRMNDREKLKEAIKINPDFEYAYVILIPILMKQGLPIEDNMLVPPKIVGKYNDYVAKYNLYAERTRQKLLLYKKEYINIGINVPLSHTTTNRKKAIIWNMADSLKSSPNQNALEILEKKLSELNYSTQMFYGSYEVNERYLRNFSSSIDTQDTVVIYVSGNFGQWPDNIFISNLKDEIVKKTSHVVFFLDRIEMRGLFGLSGFSELKDKFKNVNTLSVATNQDGLFAQALLEEIKKDNQSLSEIFNNIKAKILQKHPNIDMFIILPKVDNPVYFKK